jgi:hypothetical protein
VFLLRHYFLPEIPYALFFLVAGGDRALVVCFQQVASEPADGAMAGSKGTNACGRETRDDDVVIQRVVREVGGGMMFPVLTKNNYTEWAMLMRVKLKARGLWVTLEKGEANPHEDMMAMDALLSAVPPEKVATVAEKKTAKEAWDVIATMHMGDDRVKKAVTQQLHSQFDRATFKEGESVEDFTLR